MRPALLLPGILVLASCAPSLEERDARALEAPGAELREVCRIPCRPFVQSDYYPVRFRQVGGDLVLLFFVRTTEWIDNHAVLVRLRPSGNGLAGEPPTDLSLYFQRAPTVDVTSGARPRIVYDDLRDSHRPSDEFDFLNLRSGHSGGGLIAVGDWVAFLKTGLPFVHTAAVHVVLARLAPEGPEVVASRQLHGVFTYGDTRLEGLAAAPDRAWVLDSYENELHLREATASGWRWHLTLQEAVPAGSARRDVRGASLALFEGRPVAAWIAGRRGSELRIASVPEDGPALVETFALASGSAPDPPGHERHG